MPYVKIFVIILLVYGSNIAWSDSPIQSQNACLNMIKNSKMNINQVIPPGASISDITKMLGVGDPVITKVQDKLYKWRNFYVFVSSFGANGFSGIPARQVPNNNPNTISKILGNPDQIVTEELTQYRWECPDSNHSNIEVVMTNSGAMAGVRVTDCRSGTCYAGFATINGSDLQHGYMGLMHR